MDNLFVDITDVRTEIGLNKLKQVQKARFKNVGDIDLICNLDKQWRIELGNKQKIEENINKNQKMITQSKKEGNVCVDELMEQNNQLKQDLEEQIEIVNKLVTQRDEHWDKIGNIVHPSVPISDNEDDNLVIKVEGEPKMSEHAPLHHSELIMKINGCNLESGSVISGHRGYFLKGSAVLLNQALINYAMHFLSSKDYELIQTPFYMNQNIMAKTAQLEDFDEQLYKLVDGGEPKYLIATSEQPISALHMNEWLMEKDLPKKYCGYSTCFRKEAGSSGKDLRGIFRVHQFEKIEQFCITNPDDSWEMFDKMLQNSEDFYKSLNIPYRVVSIVSGKLNNAAAKKYDIEAWFPNTQEYRELVSCSNCTDYQSKRLGIRYRSNDKDKKYVHMLNSTLVATERTICCILENYQRNDGIEVPEVLVKYMNGTRFIPFVKHNK